MTDTPPPEPVFSGIDLAKSFLPDWAKDVAPSRIVERYGRDEEPRREAGRGGRATGRGHQDRGQRDGRRERDGRGQRDSRRPDSRRDPREVRPPEAPPALVGWTATVVPDPRGVEGLVKQIRSGGKAYPIFALALLILEKPERYRVELRRDSGQAPDLFQLSLDGSLWTTAKEAGRHALAKHLEKFYRRERVSVEPPKGSFSCVAVCGDIVLGPPNHHDYQKRLREIHAARFRNLSFDAFKNRVQMVKDPEFIEKWKQERSSKDEFFALESPEGSARFPDLESVESHFLANHAGTLIAAVENRVEISGLAAASSPVVRQLAGHAVSDLRRFPLPLAHILGQGFNSAGLQVFKAHENITYVGVARPRHLDRAAAPVAEGLAAILDYLEAHPTVPRPDQWKALLALRTTPAEESARESSLASDLSWLIHQGHVMDYAKRGLEAVRKPKPHRDGPPKKDK
ncbi:MAG: hypothetical protein WCQ16_04510 [Verrucomicrobiae bacterium]